MKKICLAFWFYCACLSWPWALGKECNKNCGKMAKSLKYVLNVFFSVFWWRRRRVTPLYTQYRFWVKRGRLRTRTFQHRERPWMKRESEKTQRLSRRKEIWRRDKNLPDRMDCCMRSRHLLAPQIVFRIANFCRSLASFVLDVVIPLSNSFTLTCC